MLAFLTSDGTGTDDGLCKTHENMIHTAGVIDAVNASDAVMHSCMPMTCNCTHI